MADARHACRIQDTWSFVEPWLPAAPARVLEIRCRMLGGFVPMLLDAGHEAVGVDLVAPPGETYRHLEFEAYEAAADSLDAVVASRSLHHVADLDLVLRRVAPLLRRGAPAIVVEWDWEAMDDPTAAWCFDRLGPAGAEQSWLHHHRDRWRARDIRWRTYLREWADDEAMHSGHRLRAALHAAFEARTSASAPYFACDLYSTTVADEQAAIDAGTIRATGIRFVGVAP
jgi:SAM-dependent methyltransferase